jgi:hypothetical protein
METRGEILERRRSITTIDYDSLDFSKHKKKQNAASSNFRNLPPPANKAALADYLRKPPCYEVCLRSLRSIIITNNHNAAS